MTQPNKRWLVFPPLTDFARAALGEFSPVVAQILFNRGYATAEAAHAFLHAELSHPDDPLAMHGMAATLDRLRFAVAHGEPLAVYGDYDSDGVTATALLVQTLTALGANVRPYIPLREEEGYGLNHEALRKLHADGVRLVVTVDCGIRSLAEADTARALGLDIIITDHHTPGAELPPALAVVNPKQAEDAYGYKELAGVGLAYKIAQGLIRPLAKPPLHGSDVLDLVALGTVADLAPLTGENRRLVKHGLGVLNRPQPKREGLRALLLVAGLKPGGVDAGTIGFVLGPRLNAAGRLESALAAYELLTTADMYRAGHLAAQLEQQNRDRQELTRQTQAQARELALAQPGEPALLFAASPDFRAGVVGLAAARLTEEFYRPAVVAHQDDTHTRGSARSIREFHITQALDTCADLLDKHGGHAAAAGFTVARHHTESLAERLRAVAEQALAGLDLRPTLHIDAEVPLSAVTYDLERELRQFQPCGYGNPTPLLASRGVKVTEARLIGKEGKHLRLKLSDGRVMWDAVAFGMGALHANLPGKEVDVAYHVELNTWQGSARLQLNVRDLRLWA